MYLQEATAHTLSHRFADNDITLDGLCESQSDRIHAIAQAGGPGAIVKNVSAVSLASPARYGGPCHPVADIYTLDDVFLRYRRPEARPAGAGFELGFRTELRGIATDAAEDSFVMHVQKRARSGDFSAGTTSNFKRGSRQLRLPFRVGFPDHRNRNHSLAHAGIREFNN